MKSLLEKNNNNLQLVRCLGWCGKTFLSPDRVGIRYCKKCALKKEQVERGMAHIRQVGGNIPSFSLEE